jgi:hypothetical protein
LNEPETEKIVRNRGKYKTSHGESWRSLPPTRAGAAPFRLVGGTAPVVVARQGLGAAPVIWKRRLEVGKDLKTKD